MFHNVFQEMVRMVFQNVFHKVGWLEKKLGRNDRFRTSGSTFWSQSTESRSGSISYLSLVVRDGKHGLFLWLTLRISIRHSKMILFSVVLLTFSNIEWIMNSQNRYCHKVPQAKPLHDIDLTFQNDWNSNGFIDILNFRMIMISQNLYFCKVP